MDKQMDKHYFVYVDSAYATDSRIVKNEKEAEEEARRWFIERLKRSEIAFHTEVEEN